MLAFSPVFCFVRNSLLVWSYYFTSSRFSRSRLWVCCYWWFSLLVPAVLEYQPNVFWRTVSASLWFQYRKPYLSNNTFSMISFLQNNSVYSQKQNFPCIYSVSKTSILDILMNHCCVQDSFSVFLPNIDFYVPFIFKFHEFEILTTFMHIIKSKFNSVTMFFETHSGEGKELFLDCLL